MKYKHVTVGGTWDHFHKGHQVILNKAFELGEVVWIGVTSSVYLSTVDPKSAKYSHTIEQFEKRQANVLDFLQGKRLLERAKVMPIDDKWGTTLTDESLEAIIVSPETELVATEINLLRAQKNWPGLDVILVPWVLAHDGNPIHSVLIRQGEIDRAGNAYDLPKNWGTRSLPKNLRQEFKKPLGKLFADLGHLSYLSDLRDRKLISVGDAVTYFLLKIGITPDVSIVDLQIARKPVYKNVAQLGFRKIKILKTVKNPAGTLSFAGLKTLSSLIRSEARPAVLLVDGEEDLFTLLALFLAPLSSLIVYGQPDQGIVAIKVTEEKKRLAKHYLEQFISS